MKPRPMRNFRAYGLGNLDLSWIPLLKYTLGSGGQTISVPDQV